MRPLGDHGRARRGARRGNHFAMATIKIPPVLRASVGGEKELSAAGDNVGAVLRDLASSHPATRASCSRATASSTAT